MSTDTDHREEQSPTPPRPPTLGPGMRMQPLGMPVARAA
ncbi:MAG: hypothetical protein QOD72_2676, partial [Acidimicrobiaceae bacterium]|nr:hypothetical protein [Acidimicrobiaceae bacterium]